MYINIHSPSHLFRLPNEGKKTIERLNNQGEFNFDPVGLIHTNRLFQSLFVKDINDIFLRHDFLFFSEHLVLCIQLIANINLEI